MRKKRVLKTQELESILDYLIEGWSLAVAIRKTLGVFSNKIQREVLKEVRISYVNRVMRKENIKFKKMSPVNTYLNRMIYEGNLRRIRHGQVPLDYIKSYSND
jgi:hypothetical protein